jgi:uncharacterized protein YdiU (UPF0061 family)
LNINFDNSYARDLQGMYADWHMTAAPQPSLAWLNEPLAETLGLHIADLRSDAGLAMLSASHAPAGAQPIAQAYAGHQFGHFSPQLGDGRALLLGEVIDTKGQRHDIAFKGSGRTPFSRGGDGKATLSSVLREVLVSECMHALGVPSTRALAAVATGENIRREGMQPAGVLTRIAASHLRVGTFEFFAARGDNDALRRLVDYAIQRHYPIQKEQTTPVANKAIYLLEQVINKQAKLIAQWMGYGFIHGVMNTDNMSISGETIDFGPCAFMEAYNPQTVFSSIDAQGRYAYANQPAIAKWNLSRFASALLPLIHEDDDQASTLALAALSEFDAHYANDSLAVWRSKLGLQTTVVADQHANEDHQLALDFLQLLQDQSIDFTQGWRSLVDVLVADIENTKITSTVFATLFSNSNAANSWFTRWQQRLQQQTAVRHKQLASMQRANPIYIARNHLVEEALYNATVQNDWTAFNVLLAAIQNPFQVGEHDIKLASPAPLELTACYKTFCGT